VVAVDRSSFSPSPFIPGLRSWRLACSPCGGSEVTASRTSLAQVARLLAAAGADLRRGQPALSMKPRAGADPDYRAQIVALAILGRFDPAHD